jgi:hypothetical protein
MLEQRQHITQALTLDKQAFGIIGHVAGPAGPALPARTPARREKTKTHTFKRG